MEEKKRMASCLVDYEHDLWNPIQIRKAPCSEKKGKKKTTKEQKEYTSLKSVMCSGCGIKYHKRPLSGVHYLISCFPLKKFLSPKFRPQQALSYQNGLWTNH